jgi:hypothetical protein
MGISSLRSRIACCTQKNWKTFHDFLIAYIANAFGIEWGNAELKKSLEDRHPLLLWYHKLCEQQRHFIKEPGKVASAPMTGATAAYLNLAYDLYALDHNAELQAKLVERLRNPTLFPGARYEVHVAAKLVRAGFTLAFENEDDHTTSHCEFTATYTRTGKQFSVEAKRSESGRIIRQVVRALKKTADHSRIIFIDMNSPDPSSGAEIPAYVERAFNLLRRFETLDPQAARLPPAYVILTNAPWEHHLESTEHRQAALADGFHIDDFKLDHAHQSVRAAVDSRQAHIEMHELMKSMREHSEIPSTFDGENPELAFVESENRLLIGNTYLVPDGEGGEVEGRLTTATVLEQDGAAICGVETSSGRSVLLRVPLSRAELAAWKHHPETFFGEISRNRSSKTPIDLYDFFIETYSQSTKTKLLELLSGAPDIEQLKALAQPELARVYSERLAAHIAATSGQPQEPVLRSKWQGRTKKI